VRQRWAINREKSKKKKHASRETYFYQTDFMKNQQKFEK